MLLSNKKFELILWQVDLVASWSHESWSGDDWSRENWSRDTELLVCFQQNSLHGYWKMCTSWMAMFFPAFGWKDCKKFSFWEMQQLSVILIVQTNKAVFFTSGEHSCVILVLLLLCVYYFQIFLPPWSSTKVHALLFWFSGGIDTLGHARLNEH